MIKLLVFIIALSALALPVVKRIRRRLAEQKLKENPPELVRLLVKLPADAEKTNERMMRFWERVHKLLPNDDKLLATNQNVLHAGLIGEGGPPGHGSRVWFGVWCPKELAERVEMTLVECYHSEVQITELKPEDDPFLQYVLKHRELRQWQAAQAQARASASAHDEEED